jgi:glycosyltransferase involved in cell wall biosynthesis
VIGDPIDCERCPDAPRKDYDALAERLDADVLHAGELPKAVGRTRGGIALARRAAQRYDDYDAVYCDSEHIGFPLAYLLRGRARRPRLTMIAHYLTPLKKRLPARLLGLHRAIDTICLHSPSQLERARWMGFSDAQLALVPYQVDASFWQPDKSARETHILSVGREFRDYRTLVRAVAGRAVRLHIAAGSQWSSRKSNVKRDALPPNVSLEALGYDDLRRMYGTAHFVVVPLHDVDFQAGIITILEAMAMGKAVIVTRTRGQTGTVSGRMMRDGVLEEIGEQAWPEETGIYVPPTDERSLGDAIDYLMTNPGVARRMGEAGRRHVEANLSLERFTARLSAIITSSRDPQPSQLVVA